MVKASCGFKRWPIGIVMIVLMILAAGLSTLRGMTSPEPSAIQFFYWYVLPALPFLVLAILAFLPNLIQTYMIMGAALGAALALAIPHVLMWRSIASGQGGGVDMGVALLFLAMPVYLPVFMVGGAAVARVFIEGRGRRGLI